MKIISIIHKILRKLQLRSVLNSYVDGSSKLEAGTSFVNSTMDRHSFCGYYCDIYFTDIGAFVSIANDVVIGGGEHPVQWSSMSPVFYKGSDSVKKKFSTFERSPIKRTVIGSDVWIGRGAIIKSGVKIGHGAVVGMGSIVTKDVGPYEIWGGNPAKKISDRFTDETKELFLEIKWWELPDYELSKYADLIRNPLEFIEAIKKDKGDCK